MTSRMGRFLFIGPDHGATVGGREQLSRLHRNVLRDLLGERFDEIVLPPSPLGGLRALAAIGSGRINGIDRAVEQRVIDQITARGVTQVWLDGSNLGALAAAIKARAPAVEVFTFFHNIEPRFFLGALRHRPSPRALGVFAASFVAERKAARSSDRLIALNARDSDALRRWHGRPASDVLPMAMDDQWPGTTATTPAAGRKLLFVGGSFYANKAGIAWFARHVAPAVQVDTIVVGSGMDDERAALERAGRVTVIGRVEDLAPYYRDALAVIAPIFDGSGMKTKVAEAWMHGKTVIGTSEAFAGYEDVGAPRPVDDAAGFIAAIDALAKAPPPAFDPALRALYEEHFSRAALSAKLARMIAPSTPAR
jgi:glycosyltransferase involved in cell wall biosynthesis